MYKHPALHAYPFPNPLQAESLELAPTEADGKLIYDNKFEDLALSMNSGDLPAFPSHMQQPHKPNSALGAPFPAFDKNWSHKFYDSSVVEQGLHRYPCTSCQPTNVLPGLFIGGAASQLNADQQIERNVRHVLLLGPGMIPAYSGSVWNAKLEHSEIKQPFYETSSKNQRRPPPMNYRVVPRVRCYPADAWWTGVRSPHVAWWLNMFTTAQTYFDHAVANISKEGGAMLIASYHGQCRAKYILAALLVSNQNKKTFGIWSANGALSLLNYHHSNDMTVYTKELQVKMKDVQYDLTNLDDMLVSKNACLDIAAAEEALNLWEERHTTGTSARELRDHMWCLVQKDYGTLSRMFSSKKYYLFIWSAILAILFIIIWLFMYGKYLEPLARNLQHEWKLRRQEAVARRQQRIKEEM